jgi:serine/threonine protein kinase
LPPSARRARVNRVVRELWRGLVRLRRGAATARPCRSSAGVGTERRWAEAVGDRQARSEDPGLRTRQGDWRRHPALDPDVSPTITSPAMTAHGIILGTAAHMSPEQAKDRAVDKRADIRAFGVILYEMMTGQRLHQGDSMSKTLAAVLKEEAEEELISEAKRRLRAKRGACPAADSHEPRSGESTSGNPARASDRRDASCT